VAEYCADRSEVRFKVEFASCPVEASLGVLGRKWALLVLRDIAMLRADRFNDMLRRTPGMTKRVLAMRLNELEREGFIYRRERAPKFTRWALTEKGQDTLPVLMTLVQFGAKWHAERVFADRLARPLDAVFDRDYIQEILRGTGRTSRRARNHSLPHSRAQSASTAQALVA
jgi:DNA-binding HxlR family transcriptional regulator